MNDSKDHKAAAEPPLDCRVVPDWVGGFLNRRAAVEQTLLNCAAGRQPLPTADMCRDLALKLGVPDEYRVCRHRFAVEDLKKTGIPELEVPATNGYQEWADYRSAKHKHDGYAKRVAWPCDKCGKVFYANCGLDISPNHGPTFRRGTTPEGEI